MNLDSEKKIEESSSIDFGKKPSHRKVISLAVLGVGILGISGAVEFGLVKGFSKNSASLTPPKVPHRFTLYQSCFDNVSPGYKMANLKISANVPFEKEEDLTVATFTGEGKLMSVNTVIWKKDGFYVLGEPTDGVREELGPKPLGQLWDLDKDFLDTKLFEGDIAPKDVANAAPEAEVKTDGNC